MINDHQIDAKVLNKIGFVTVDDQSKKYHKEFSGILYQSAVGSTTFFAKRSGLGSKPCFGGLKPSKTRSNFWGGFVICIEKNILEKNWSKTTIPALSSGQTENDTSIWGRRHQLDDHNRNPNMNNRDHLVGRPTRGLLH